MRRLAGYWDLALVLALLALAALALTGPAHAMTVTPNGAEWTVEYDEPTTNADGSPLQDLTETRVRYQIGSGPVTDCQVGPATAPTGAGHVSTTCLVPLTGAVETTVTFDVVAVDDAQPVPNVSAPSAPVVKDYDTLAPAAPN